MAKKFSDEKTQITSVRQQPANFDSFERRPSKSFVCRLFLSTFAIRVIHLAFVVSYFPLLVWLLPPSTFHYTLFEKSPKKFHFEFSRQKTPLKSKSTFWIFASKIWNVQIDIFELYI